ncbi:SusC/RagA family TonB-linked outer membrane protein [Tellurirhabdus bombi]|uniref:SusC/RagA family TonB-linked outer membrane protein n=1 Tax=Tellurirhabdus bombi TaxID=2907205 RepID=UPI001F390968|nr:SusC/RagA family TonB-linked outer membrane protein [Tellurirhabdus bombi]
MPLQTISQSIQETLSDSVRVGYGSVSREKLSAPVETVSGESLTRFSTGNVLQALQGRVAGVLVTANSGDPGGAVTVTMRGPGRFGDTNPLVVVDGMIIGQTDNLNWLSPNDIETVSVLKDASAASYGMRGGNGVILITTKHGGKGKAGGLRVSAETYVGVQSLTTKPQLLNTRQYLDFVNQSRANGGYLPAARLTNAQSVDTLLRTNTDWVGALFRSAAVRNSAVSVSGSGDKARYYFSANQYKQKGILLGTDFERLAARINTEFDLRPDLRVGQHLTINQTNQHINQGTTSRTAIEQALKSAPYLPIRNNAFIGGYNGPNYMDANNDARNPVGQSNLIRTGQKTFGITGDLYAEWDLFENLTYRATLGYDRRNFEGLRTAPAYIMGEFDSNPTAASARVKQNYQSLLLEHQLTYVGSVDDHSLTVLLAGSRQTSKVDDIEIAKEGLPENDIWSLSAAQTTPNGIAGGQYTTYRIVSLLGQVFYEYKEKYVLTGTVRRDGSSRFASGNRFGIFPAISAGWLVSEGRFFDKIPLTRLKVRAGWGQTGNDNVGDYRYASRISQNFNYPFGSQNTFLGIGAIPATLPNPLIRWETTSTSNLGIDFNTPNDAISLSIDYYLKQTKNILVETPLPSSVGAAAPLINGGKVRNQGLDVTLTAKETVGSVSLDVSGFASWQRNRVISLGARTEPILNGSFDDKFVNRTMPGYAMGSFYGLKQLGIYQNIGQVNAAPGLPGSSPGDIQFVDLNGDNEVTLADDQAFIGKPIPSFHYGLSLAASVSGFDVVMLLQGVAGNQIYNTTAYWLNGYQGRYNAGTQVLNRWTVDNPSTTQPRANASDNVNFQVSNRFVESGAYFRLRTLQIGYTLPKDLLSGLGVSSLRIYVGGQNLFTKTKYSGFDPEFSNNQSLVSGIDVGVQPQPRTLLGGIQLNF